MEKFERIIEKSRQAELSDFLRLLSPEEKKELVPTIKSLTKIYQEFGDTGGGRWGYKKGSEKQREMLQLASFVCMSRADYEKTNRFAWLQEREKLDPVLSWYCPPWFGDLVNKMVEEGSLPYSLNYDWVMDLADRGMIVPSKQLIVRLLPQYIFYADKNRNWYFQPQRLFTRPATMEHIWWLFELESFINSAGNHMRFADGTPNDKGNWIEVFKKYTAEKKIARDRVLQEALLASNRNFSKPLSGWFAELYLALTPDKNEILSLQHTLFGVLNATNSKPVNTALQSIKQILTENAFDSAAFLDSAASLLSSTVKATVASTLMALEKIAAKKAEHKAQICGLVTQVFIHADNELQVRAAKIIHKFGDPGDPALKEAVGNFYTVMMNGAKALLSDFKAETKEAPLEAQDLAQKENPLRAVVIPETIEDLVFFASQAFDNNAPWHIDVLPAALIRLQSGLRPEDLIRFEPAFQRALQLQKNGMRANDGYLDVLLAIFFIDVGHWMMRKFPESAGSIKAVYQKFDEVAGGKTTSWITVPQEGSYTIRWQTHKRLPYYRTYKQILASGLLQLNAESGLVPLSTPSFENGTIEPRMLIDRIRAFQQAVVTMNSMDLQIALSRCRLDNREVHIDYAREQLRGEMRALLVYLLDRHSIPVPPFKSLESWLVIALRKKDKKSWEEFGAAAQLKTTLPNYTGELSWKSFEEQYAASEYNYELRKSVTVQKTRKILKVTDATKVEKQGWTVKKFVSGLFTSPTHVERPAFLYELMRWTTSWLDNEGNDMQRIFSLIPDTPSALLTSITKRCLCDPGPVNESDKKVIVAALQFLHESWTTAGEMEYLFLGTCMLSADKTVANIAAEIWIKYIPDETIDSARIGEVIGRHESIEFAPLKRFTDLISLQLFRVSSVHNAALQNMLAKIIVHLPEEPIKNLKRLLEIYFELVAENGKQIKDPEVVKKISGWKNRASLQKLVEGWV